MAAQEPTVGCQHAIILSFQMALQEATVGCGLSVRYIPISVATHTGDRMGNGG